ncbi:ArsR/SmtB family transcription factor [Amycolatopsis umgeniensis]|uniref:DNA-binding transcriptional ArsR family regulator n=1 Tax=Amycolatopsis umgeniensis TaxID=336628 RepID=A0A841AWP9_9PSEU|nr:metalloregulator ArsR/SmtB family transcription factor [Amycolatopsis umgeniensis]MBB5850548.1 DNA-binding transcriptional ArsR family regulator [Amycolatopsis umgeniensis]
MPKKQDDLRLGGEADFTSPAELVGHPARSAILLALLDGRALPMSVLAVEAGVAPSTTSAHLTRLTEGGLLRVRRQGRHAYYELASARVAEALEALARLAPPRPVRSLRGDGRARALRSARTCYDHLAGQLGVEVMRSLLASHALEGGDGLHHPESSGHDRLSAPGKDIEYHVTETGWEFFGGLGVVVPAGRRKVVRYCVDWTEQRHHLAGALGAALLTRAEELGWVARRAKGVPRALRVTDEGREGFAEFFGFDFAQPEAA